MAEEPDVSTHLLSYWITKKRKHLFHSHAGLNGYDIIGGQLSLECIPAPRDQKRQCSCNDEQ